MKKLFHIHNFDTPIVSMYVSFNTRNIIYQCSCGNKKAELVHRPIDKSFPIETTNFITNEEFLKILNNNI